MPKKQNTYCKTKISSEFSNMNVGSANGIISVVNGYFPHVNMTSVGVPVPWLFEQRSGPEPWEPGKRI